MTPQTRSELKSAAEMGLICAAILFFLPIFFGGQGKVLLVSVVGAPVGFLIAGILGYVIAVLRHRRG